MTKLTEEIIRQRMRNCSPPLDMLIEINLTGRDLDNISLVRCMSNIQILSLSVNRISCLADLKHCKHLKELYLRRNNIADINQIYYIKDLPQLAILGLSQNPCSECCDYRPTVIRNIPTLQRLDDENISTEERVEALRKGRKVYNPEEGNSCQLFPRDKSPSSAAAPPNSEIISTSSDTKFLELVKNWSRHSGKFRSDAIGESQSTNRDRSPQEKPDVGQHRNLLSGILILIAELDYPSLEVLNRNIKNRLDQCKKK